MRRKRITGRFYVFLVLLLIGGYFILRELFPSAPMEAVVSVANAEYVRFVDAVIVRDEEVIGYEGTSRIVFVASEGAQVVEGDTVCDVYSAGYTDKEVEKLETIRQSIRAFNEQLLDNIVDTELDRTEQKVEQNAVQLKTLIRQKSGGSLLNLQKQLEESMLARQKHLSRNHSYVPKLDSLYIEEEKRVKAIESWKYAALAPRAGVVSFYLDGYENVLKADALSELTFEDVRAILDNGKPANASAQSRLVTNVFRVVSNDKWYVILLSKDTSWNPISGSLITFTMDGFPDVQYAGTVVRLQKSADEVMAQLEVNGALGPLFNQRRGTAKIGAFMTGLSVPSRAVSQQAGQTGVWVSDTPGGSIFVAVEVLSSDRNNALVSPLVEGTLLNGQRVLIK